MPTTTSLTQQEITLVQRDWDKLEEIAEHFGVQAHHYETLAVALLWTLRQGRGSQFGPENEAAWTKVYAVLADAMKPHPADRPA